MDRHEVPTHLDVEDRLFWGLTLPRLFGVVATLGTAYGFYSRFPWAGLGLEDSALRWAIPASVAALGIGLSLVRVGGRSVASWVIDGLTFLVRPHTFSGSPFPSENAHEKGALDGRSVVRGRELP